MEPDLLREAALYEKIGLPNRQKELRSTEPSPTIHTVAIQLESRVVQNEVYSSPISLPHRLDTIPKAIHIIAQDIFLRGSQMLATCGLERFDLFFGHIDEERQVCRIAPQTDYGSALSLL